MNLNTFIKTLISFAFILQVASADFRSKLPFARIVGGSFASQNKFPYIVSIQGNGVLCGGSIISRNYIVTAAHCVNKFAASTISIRAGTTELRSGGIVVGVSQVKSHPNYVNHNNDIAVLKLSKSLCFNNNIKPIALATQNPPAGSSIVVSGWGGTSDGGPISMKLKYNTLKGLSIDECKRRLNPLPATTICFGHTAGNSICGGDSGGPAVYNNQLVGVASYGVNGCNSDVPNGFSSVAILNRWIRQQAEM